MRKLYVKRERALACFALTYHCVLGQPVGEHLRRIELQDRAELMRRHEPGSMRNGETVCLELDEGESSLFVIAYQEHGTLTTEPLPIPAGTADLHFTVTTQFDGDHRLTLALTRDAD